uniref:RNase H type-1 domain-containing protein n=1 Tax=Fagus sylvatica TaxID=28930 RepID=A0A2N9FLE6_FAGSY
MDEETKTLPSSSNPGQMKKVWEKVWSLKVPRKIQMFTWRALKDSLPTKLNLKRRHILIDLVCEMYETGIKVVVRDHAGTCIATLSQKIRFPQLVDTIEAMAAKRAVSFALNLGLRSVEFKGDSTTITEALNGNNYSQAIYGLLIDDARLQANNLLKHTGDSCPRVSSTSSTLYQSSSLDGGFTTELEPLLFSDLHP